MSTSLGEWRGDLIQAHDTVHKLLVAARTDPVLRGWCHELEEILVRVALSLERRDELLTAAYTYLDRYVDVDDAKIDGFDLAEWCRQADALDVPPRESRDHITPA